MCGPGSVREMALYVWAGFRQGDGHIYCRPGSVREMALYTVVIGSLTTRMVAYHQHSSGAGLWTGTIVSSQW